MINHIRNIIGGSLMLIGVRLISREAREKYAEEIYRRKLAEKLTQTLEHARQIVDEHEREKAEQN